VRIGLAMFRFVSPRFVAALFAFLSASVCIAPASAQTEPAAAAAPVAAMVNVMRSFNPQLTIAKAQAYARSVMADAMRTHLDPKFIMSIVTVESHWRSNAVSAVGAQGLGQLMPYTAKKLGVNPHVPSDNLRGTSNYLRSLMNTFKNKPNAVKLAIAGYNAGPKAVQKYHGIPPYAETQTYVTRVLHVWHQLDGRVGNALAVKPAKAEPVVAATPEEKQWIPAATSDAPVVTDAALPAAATADAAAATLPATSETTTAP